MATVNVHQLLPRSERFFTTAPCMDLVCHSCGEKIPEQECANSQRPCGHHCNHSWHMDQCCWCLQMFGEVPGDPEHFPGDAERVAREKMQWYQDAANLQFLRGDTTSAVLYLGHHAKLARGEYPADWEVNDG